jgi:hypothetical protein
MDFMLFKILAYSMQDLGIRYAIVANSKNVEERADSSLCSVVSRRQISNVCSESFELNLERTHIQELQFMRFTKL